MTVEPSERLPVPNPQTDAPPSSPSEKRSLPQWLFEKPVEPAIPWLLLGTLAAMLVGLLLQWPWLGFTASVVAVMIALQVLLPSTRAWLQRYLTPQERRTLIGGFSLLVAVGVLAYYVGVYETIGKFLNQFKYDEFGSWAEWVGALGQIMIALLAVYVAWQQYVISRDLTIQQNRITQQQTIDAFFQGVSELALNQEGMLEDWPQERAFAEGRTAAILAGVDSTGKAKILRFLSQSRLLTPLRRDHYLGRPIFDGLGGYQEDREQGIRVINLGVILVAADLTGQDLRWVDLSEVYLIRANLFQADLVKTNFARTVLFEANLAGADLKGTRFFYGSLDNATPRSRHHHQTPNYQTGEYTGAVVENVNFRGVKNLSEEQRCYCCAWGGELTRKTIPGGCKDIENRLGR